MTSRQVLPTPPSPVTTNFRLTSGYKAALPLVSQLHTPRKRESPDATLRFEVIAVAAVHEF